MREMKPKNPSHRTTHDVFFIFFKVFLIDWANIKKNGKKYRQWINMFLVCENLRWKKWFSPLIHSPSLSSSHYIKIIIVIIKNYQVRSKKEERKKRKFSWERCECEWVSERVKKSWNHDNNYKTTKNCFNPVTGTEFYIFSLHFCHI